MRGTGVAVCTSDFDSTGNCSTQLFPTNTYNLCLKAKSLTLRRDFGIR